MDFGKQLWAAYLDTHMPATEKPEMDTLRGSALTERLWVFSDAIRPRTAAIESVPFDPDFNREADEALIAIAVAGDFTPLGTISLGAWKVLSCRWGWAIAAITIEEHAGTVISIPTPERASLHQRAVLATLAVLGGWARDVPAAWSQGTPAGELDQLLMRGPSRPH